MKKKKTTQEFYNEVKELTNGEFELVSEYKRKDIKVIIKHIKCNGEFSISPSNFLNDLQCKCCKEKINLFERYGIKNHNDFVTFIKNKTNEFDIIGKLVNEDTKIRVIHKKCNTEEDVIPKKFIHNQLCRVCDGGNLVDFYGFVKKVYDKYQYEYAVIDRNNNDFVFVHTKCKTKFTMKSKKFLDNNNPCPICGKKDKWNLKKVKTKIRQATENEFECIDDKYNNVDAPMRIKHNVCGKEFLNSFNAFLKTPKCPICEKEISLGEKLTGKILKKFNLDFDREFSINDCKNVNALRFDFVVYDKVGNILCLIEFDGEEHYFPVFTDDVDILETNRKRDEIKNQYCKDNNIILIRIPYWEINNIEKFLKKEFKKYFKEIV